MQRQPQSSKADLMNYYQMGLAENQMKKVQDKNNRIEMEKKMLNQLNREIEDEKKNRFDAKLQRNNILMEEYNLAQQRKQMEKEKNKDRRQVSQFENYGNYKIGADNREIKRKNYEDVTNSLLLNPTRKSEVAYLRNVVQDMSNVRHQGRGRSQGFNIINHSLPNINTINNTMNDNQMPLEENKQEYIQQELNNYNQNPNDMQINPQSNIDPYSYKPSYNNDYNKPYEEDGEYERFYQEMLKQQKESLDHNHLPQNNFQQYDGPNVMNTYQEPPQEMNEMESKMKNMSINQYATTKEYQYNRQKNNGLFFNNDNNSQQINKENVNINLNLKFFS